MAGFAFLRSRAAVAAITFAATAVAVGGVGYAVASSSPGSGATFYGCASSTGAIRSSSIRVGTAPTCRTGETLQTWDQQGPQGAQGPVGQASVVNLTDAADCPKPPPAPTDPATAPASRAFLDIPSIPGDSVDARHANQIDVVSWSWGAVNGSGACGTTPKGGAFLDFEIIKHVDKASPGLAKATVNGTNLSTITFRLSNSQFDYLTLALDNAVVTSYQFVGGGNNVLPNEKVTIASSHITYTLTPQRADGTPGTPISFCYDTQGQVAC